MSASQQSPVAPLTDAQRKLVEDNMSLVDVMARGWRASCRTTIEHSELVQVGACGLVDAARRFDPARGVPFAAMAAERIRGAICDFLRSLDPLTRDRRKAVRSLQAASATLANQLGRDPEATEIATHLGWKVTSVDDARGDEVALSKGMAQVCDATSLAETEVDNHGGEEDSTAFRSVLRSEMAAALDNALALIPERERLILDLHYRKDTSITEIGAMLGVTPSRISQLHTAAVERLRVIMAAQAAGGDVTAPRATNQRASARRAPKSAHRGLRAPAAPSPRAA